MKRAWRILAGLGAATVALLAVQWAMRRRRLINSVEQIGSVERRSVPDPVSMEGIGQGASGAKFDLERLKELKEASFKPLVEYLTFIQVRRNEGESLVFVRDRDVDVLAALSGATRQEFVQEFQQLGVLLSLN